MRKLSFICALFLANIAAVTAAAADLTKIDRTIAKEPVYQNQPKYCLLVFGPDAKTRVWLVIDGDVLYVDRNGNGDLTEQGERLELMKPECDITEPDRGTKHTGFLVKPQRPSKKGSDPLPLHRFCCGKRAKLVAGARGLTPF
jgi:hypothetical protein